MQYLAWTFLCFLAVTCVALTAATTVFLMRRKTRLRSRLQHELDCRRRIVELLGEFAFGDGQPPAPQRIEPALRPVFQEELVKQIVSLKGPERDFLLRLYGDMGFLAEDIASLSARGWPQRLLAVARLEYLEAPAVAEAVAPLLADPQPLVALTAAKILARQGGRLDTASLLKALARGGSSRVDAWIEVLGELCRHDEAAFIDSVVNYRLGNATHFGVAVLGHRKAISAVAPLLRFLEPLCAQQGAEAILREGALALGRIGDPRSVALLTRLIAHSEPKVRAAAVWGLSVTDPEALVPELTALAGDPSLQVRRAAFHARKGRQG